MTKKTKKTLFQLIGLTGGIATGKSTLAQCFRTSGYPIIDADLIAKELLDLNKISYKEVVKTFNKKILNPNKTINRPLLGELVFQNIKAKKQLETIVHPRMIKEIKKQITHYRKQKHSLIILDMAILYELKLNNLCDKVICVTSTQEQQVFRLVKHRKMTKKHALNRIKAQMPLKIKAKQADFVIKNIKTKKELRKEAVNLLNHLTCNKNIL